MELLIAIILVLIFINTWMMFKLFLNPTRVITPAMKAIKAIDEVYTILNEMADGTDTHKVSIGRVCYTSDEPFVEILYDNNIVDEIRYNKKFNKIFLDQKMVDEFKLVSKGDVLKITISDLSAGQRKTICQHEDIKYSEIHKIIENDSVMYVLGLHHKKEIGEIKQVSPNIYVDRLIDIFQNNETDT